MGELQLITILVGTAVGAMSVGVTIGIVIGNKEITNEWWSCIKKRVAEWREPQMICPHVAIEQNEDGDYTIKSLIPWQTTSFSRGYGYCSRCSFYSENRRGVEKDVEMWKEYPDRAQQRVRKAEKAARRNNGWSNRWYERDKYPKTHR